MLLSRFGNVRSSTRNKLTSISCIIWSFSIVTRAFDSCLWMATTPYSERILLTCSGFQRGSPEVWVTGLNSGNRYCLPFSFIRVKVSTRSEPHKSIKCTSSYFFWSSSRWWSRILSVKLHCPCWHSHPSVLIHVEYFVANSHIFSLCLALTKD